MMKKSFLLFTIFLVALACNEDGLRPKQISDIRVENGRLVFPDEKLFQATLSQLKKMDNESLTKWESQFSFNSMYERVLKLRDTDLKLTEEELEYSYFPPGESNVLNDKGEVKIGDDIIWYRSSKKYRASTEKELAGIKLDPSGAAVVGEYSISVFDIPESTDDSGARHVKWYHGQGAYTGSQTYTNQSPTSTCVDGKTRKFVDKLVAYIGNAPSGYIDGNCMHYYTAAELWIVLKVDYKNPSNDWVDSATPRLYDWNFHADIISTDPYHNTTELHQDFYSPSFSTTAKYWLPLWINQDVKVQKPNPCNGVFGPLEHDGLGWYEIDIVGTIGHDLLKNGSSCYSWDNVWAP